MTNHSPKLGITQASLHTLNTPPTQNTKIGTTFYGKTKVFYFDTMCTCSIVGSAQAPERLNKTVTIPNIITQNILFMVDIINNRVTYLRIKITYNF